MTREIKFRAWDKQGKRMLVPSIGNGGGDYDRYDEIYADSWQTFQIALGTVTGDENLILMQFTGLLDKNGKELFEGDVVKVVYDWHDDFKKRFVVDLSECHFWLKGERFGYEGENLINPDDVILLGNIYENPELLNQQKQ